jgi:hypothetical protein
VVKPVERIHLEDRGKGGEGGGGGGGEEEEEAEEEEEGWIILRVRVPDYRFRDPCFDSRRYQIF